MNKQDFLHDHPEMEKVAGLPGDVVIVDRKDWELVRERIRLEKGTSLSNIPQAQEPKKRYFIVFGSGGRNATVCFHITTAGGYVTLQDIDKAYTEQFPEFKGLIIVPSNIIELNESDYKDWVS